MGHDKDEQFRFHWHYISVTVVHKQSAVGIKEKLFKLEDLNYFQSSTAIPGYFLKLCTAFEDYISKNSFKFQLH